MVADGGILRLNSGGKGLADFVAQRLEHYRVGAVTVLQEMAHGDQVGDAGRVAVGVIGLGQVHGADGIHEGSLDLCLSVCGRVTDGGFRGVCLCRLGISASVAAISGSIVEFPGRGLRQSVCLVSVVVIDCDFSLFVGLGVLQVGLVIVPGNRFGVRLVGHQDPVHQVDAAYLDVALFGNPQHQLLEPGEAQLALVEAGDAAHQTLLERREEQRVSGRALGSDHVLNGTDDLGQLVPAGIGQGSGLLLAAAMRRSAVEGVFGSLGIDWIHVRVVKDEAVHVVGHPAGGGPGHAHHQDALSDRPEGVDDVDEIGVPGYEDESVDVGEIVRGVDAVRGHLHVNAVLDADGTTRLVGSTQRQPGGDVHRLDACCVQRRRIMDKLAGSL